ncbi:hypothetical protein GGTG_09123 [Gaeumannomyces tritici R3-111a-1]|uniref:Uncharacterized protein n=1 Tax=Gaeumannomyces tritici (strain R3-111a-1) TaxID=644352 RepID=J3P6I2_GAET3|nr:hypothetical protein GGTG_09123 [Gaeumannomyces tritici R3-111a-1]EJT72257.1 hypothetical protein GGTG_09123 [Gaeumannomyces tritici R3-111a-1]
MDGTVASAPGWRQGRTGPTRRLGSVCSGHVLPIAAWDEEAMLSRQKDASGCEALE